MKVCTIFLVVIVAKSCLHYSIIKMNVNTQKGMFTLSQGAHSVGSWTLLCREKCSLIWSPVRIISVKCLLEPSVLFPLPSVKEKNKVPLARKICWCIGIQQTSTWVFVCFCPCGNPLPSMAFLTQMSPVCFLKNNSKFFNYIHFIKVLSF